MITSKVFGFLHLLKVKTATYLAFIICLNWTSLTSKNRNHKSNPVSHSSFLVPLSETKYTRDCGLTQDGAERGCSVHTEEAIRWAASQLSALLGWHNLMLEGKEPLNSDGICWYHLSFSPLTRQLIEGDFRDPSQKKSSRALHSSVTPLRSH